MNACVVFRIRKENSDHSVNLTSTVQIQKSFISLKGLKQKPYQNNILTQYKTQS